jgi:two-component system, LytTR family, response regulator
MTNIPVPTSKGLEFLPLQNIIRIQSKSNYSTIYFADKSYPLTVARVLKWFEEQLPAPAFLRTHRTHLINRQYFKQFIATSHLIQMSNGDTIGMSRRRKQLIKQCLMA